jgi:hypothetical protein
MVRTQTWVIYLFIIFIISVRCDRPKEREESYMGRPCHKAQKLNVTLEFQDLYPYGSKKFRLGGWVWVVQLSQKNTKKFA